MINRKSLRCTACGSLVVTRTSIGHGDSQIHSFPCPGCGVGITYKLLLDQRNVGLEYIPSPENATWVESEEGAGHEVTFDAELLVPRHALSTPLMSPWMAAYDLLRDNTPIFQHKEAIRLIWRENFWPVTKRLPIHYQNENWDLFDADARKIDEKSEEDTAFSRFALLRHIYDLPFGWMLYPDAGRRSRIQQRLTLARTIAPNIVADLASQYLRSGRIAELWRQLQEFHNSFVRDFPYLSPLLQPKLYWQKPPSDLTPYALCDKRFSELKPLFIESFEIFARLSVIAIAIEVIIHHSSLEIPTKKSSIDLWSFENLPNARKPDHLSKYPISDLFSPHLDTTLRNGIGHNAARYDAASDEVVSVKQVGATLLEDRINYTVFCDQVLELCSILFHSEIYFSALVEEVDGKLR